MTTKKTAMNNEQSEPGDGTACAKALGWKESGGSGESKNESGESSGRHRLSQSPEMSIVCLLGNCSSLTLCSYS